MKDTELLEILKVCEKLKENTRHCVLSNGRVESVAEHSWRMTLMAFFMQDEFDHLDFKKIYEMCLIHDLGEAFTGDIPTFLKSTADEENEESVLTTWMNSISEPYRTALKNLYKEMEAQETLESRVYKSLDKLEALISHNESDISTWLPLEYGLQREYGNDVVKDIPYLQHLRNTVRKDSNKKIEEERQQGSAFLKTLKKIKTITLKTLRIEELQNDIYHIEDPFCSTPSSMYYIDGEKEGLWVDGANPVQPGSVQEKELQYLLEELTYHKKLSVFISHSHMDHTGFLSDAHLFENIDIHHIYISRKDYVDDAELFLNGVSALQPYADKIVFVHSSDIVEVDGKSYTVLETPPHTKGSISLVDDVHQCVFTADAFGSGYVWVFWNEDSNPLKVLEQSCQKVLDRAKGYRLFPGHRYQQFLREDSLRCGEIDTTYLEDMLEVIHGLKDITTQWVPYRERGNKDDIFLYLPNKKAKICTTKQILHAFCK